MIYAFNHLRILSSILGKFPASLRQNGNSESYTEEYSETMYMEVNQIFQKMVL